MEQEIWKPVVDYEGFYEVSSFGRVRTVTHYSKTSHGNSLRIVRSKVLRCCLCAGYPRVSLSKFGERKDVHVHNLVAVAFIPNPDKKQMIDHIDGNRENNNVTNLRWVTPRENIMNPNTHFKNSGTNHFNYGNKYSEEFKKKLRNGHKKEHKPIEQYTKDGIFVKRYDSLLDAERQTGCNNSAISACCKGVRHYKSVGGYIWKYAT